MNASTPHASGSALLPPSCNNILACALAVRAADGTGNRAGNDDTAQGIGTNAGCRVSD